MGVLVRVRPCLGATIVELDGASDPDLLASVGEAIARVRAGDVTPLVLDITGLGMVHPRGIRSLVEHLGDAERGQLRLVCRRLSGRRVVRRARVPGLVYGSAGAAVADATRSVGGPSPTVQSVVFDVFRDPARCTVRAPGALIAPG